MSERGLELDKVLKKFRFVWRGHPGISFTQMVTRICAEGVNTGILKVDEPLSDTQMEKILDFMIENPKP